MKSKHLLIIFLLFSAFGFAQKKDLAGTVKERSTGLPLFGVNIKDKNSGNSVSTDFDGKFTIKGVSAGNILLVTYVGYKSTEYVVNAGDSNIIINMVDEAKTLNEVVVIGYGSVTKKQVTGAVSVVDSKTIDAIRPVKIEQALQGTVAGVNVTTVGGAPGADISVRIRGIATNGENKPVAIIDGYQGDLSTLSPNDIESLTVLKDAQAAIYGTIGANGIILVTTKKGKRNSKPKISFNSSTGIQEASRVLPVLNATEYALLLNESYANGGKSLPYPNVSGLGEGTNWQKEILNPAPIINYDLSISGGFDKANYSASASHLEQDGIIGDDKSGFSRNTARISFGADVSDKLKLKTNVIYTNQARKTLNDNGLGSVLFNALNVPATQSPYDIYGNYSLVPSTTGLGFEIINPLAQIENTYNEYELSKFNGNLGLDYKLTDAFVVSGAFGFNTQNGQSRTFAKQLDYGNGKVFNVNRSSVTQSAVFDNSYSLDFYGTYSKKIGNHNLVGTLGTTIYKEFGNGLYATGYDVPYNSWDYADLKLAIGLPTTAPNTSYVYDERRLSYFARAQYDFKGKYLLSAMLRRDSSTKFGPANTVAYFPSMTLGWIISDENFFGGNEGFVNFLKFRGSYGVLGNDQIPNNGYNSLLNGEATYVFNGSIVSGLASGQIPNPSLKWEEAKKFDVGVDLKMFQNKINIVADYFIDTRNDLLIPYIPVSGTLGAGAPGAQSPTINAGTVRNSGIEFAVDYKNTFANKLSLSLGYNVTFIQNEVTAVNNGTGFYEGGAFGVGQPAPSRMQVGKPMGYFYGYKTNGIFQNQAEVDAAPSQIALGAEAQAGDIRYVDVNGDGIINTSDKTNIGGPIAASTMGFNLQLDYKNFDFVAYAFASIGNEMVRNYERTLTDVNHLDYVLDRWTGEGTSNTVPRVTTSATSNNVFSDYFVEDASFVRIQNIQLGYSVDSKYFEKAGVSKFRVYLGANNLYTFTKYKGYDPGASSGAPIGGGIDYGFYPIPRTYLLGVNVNF
ncbi:SusC/RagA family TonB-linked outer membrane protein [Flavobacterium aquicola]|uniref:TonB-linked SusC/RagA family outer membrane protein n=1 Tax=Flavobacterium aquicola TaxID=1682742 RepID=A0A3E0EUL6_9FLAO|nr:TonB-dependent receptor [Flavobacterium aquicola]REH01866.1 TonB-linked SusC/RagA family outer membrane protein [Flavobacterium aquicola]